MAAGTTTTWKIVSQLSCFSSINRKLQLQPCSSVFFPSSPRGKLSVVMSVEGRSKDISSWEFETAASHAATDESKPHVDEPKFYPSVEEGVTEEKGVSYLGKVYGSAKIHDFCFGIPYGGLVLTGGLLGFIFSRKPTSLITGVLFGGALLTLSNFSLKSWRQEKSSLPFVLGQAVLSAALFWKNFQAYLLTKRLIPMGFDSVISAAMLCFFVYVMISGGNPPPKKVQSSASVRS